MAGKKGLPVEGHLLGEADRLPVSRISNVLHDPSLQSRGERRETVPRDAIHGLEVMRNGAGTIRVGQSGPNGVRDLPARQMDPTSVHSKAVHLPPPHADAAVRDGVRFQRRMAFDDIGTGAVAFLLLLGRVVRTVYRGIRQQSVHHRDGTATAAAATVLFGDWRRWSAASLFASDAVTATGRSDLHRPFGIVSGLLGGPAIVRIRRNCCGCVASSKVLPPCGVLGGQVVPVRCQGE